MKLLFILLLLLPLIGSTQIEQDIYFTTLKEYFDKKDVSYHYLLADNVNLRACASSTCEKVKQLKIGSKLTLLNRSEKIDSINGIKSHWYQIKTDQTQGWLWGGFIAQRAFGSSNNTAVKFVFGLKKIVFDEGWHQKYYQIRAFKNNVELDQIEFKSSSTTIQAIKTLGSLGLKFDDAIVIEIPCEGGCGCTGGNLYTFWNGTRFSEMQNLLGTADTWASDNYYFIFPTDMEGEPNVLVKVSNQYIDADSEKLVKRKFTKQYYRWDGKQLIEDAARKKEEFYTTKK